MKKSKPKISKRILLLGLLVFLFHSKSAFSEDVTIVETYPTAYAEYNNLTVEGALIAGNIPPPFGSTVWMQSVPKVTINGDMTIHRSSSNTYGDLTMKNVMLRVSPDYNGDQTGKGPYGYDGLRVIGNGTGNVLVGSNPSKTNMKFKAETVLAANTIYVRENGLTGNAVEVYGEMRGYTDASQPSTPTTLLQHNAQFRALYSTTTPSSAVYAPMRIDGYYVRFGEKYVDRAQFNTQGHMDNVLIGAQTLVPGSYVPESVLLQVGSPNDGNGSTIPNTKAWGDWQFFSSREYKKDIAPFSPMQYSEALELINKTPVWYYRFKNDLPIYPRNIGLITEDSPKEIVALGGKALSSADTFGYLAASLKELKIRNDELKKRLDVLEKKKLQLQAISK